MQENYKDRFLRCNIIDKNYRKRQNLVTLGIRRYLKLRKIYKMRYTLGKENLNNKQLKIKKYEIKLMQKNTKFLI